MSEPRLRRPAWNPTGTPLPFRILTIAAAVAAVYFLIGSGGGEKSTPAHLRNGRGETHHRLVSNASLRFGAAAAAATFGFFVASPVAAVIVPGQGMAGIRLRMSESQVRARLGEPPRITRTRGALGYLVTRLHYPRVDVDLQKLDGHPLVIHILTTHPGERTASGVGVGSTMTAVERLRGARCWREGANRYCGIGNRAKPLSHFTMFWIGAKQRVTLISVSLVVNS